MKLASKMTNKELIDGVMQIVGPYLGYGEIDRDAAYIKVWLKELQHRIDVAEQKPPAAKDKIKELEEWDEKKWQEEK